MIKNLPFAFLLAFCILSCSLFQTELPRDEYVETTPCPLDTCQKVSIELSIPGLNYAAPFTCYEWTDWGTGLEVSWADGGRILFFTFPNHRICESQFRICAEDICDCDLPACLRQAGWQPIESCPRNNTLTAAMDSCLFGQTSLFLEVYLVDND